MAIHPMIANETTPGDVMARRAKPAMYLCMTGFVASGSIKTNQMLRGVRGINVQRDVVPLYDNR